MLKKYKEVYSGSILFVLAIAYFIGSFSIQKYGDAVVDSTFLPRILGSFLIILSIIQIINGIKYAKENIETNEKVKKMSKEVVLTLIGIAIYALFISIIGFLIMTILYIFFQSSILVPANKRNYIVTGVISITFSLAIYYIFVWGFKLTLPAGVLG